MQEIIITITGHFAVKFMMVNLKTRIIINQLEMKRGELLVFSHEGPFAQDLDKLYHEENNPHEVTALAPFQDRHYFLIRKFTQEIFADVHQFVKKRLRGVFFIFILKFIWFFLKC